MAALILSADAEGRAGSLQGEVARVRTWWAHSDVKRRAP